MPAGFWKPATRRGAATNDGGYYTPYTPYRTPYAFISDCTAFHGESEKELIYKVKQAFAFTIFYGKSCGFDNSNLSISANQVHNSDVVDFFFCYQRIFGGLGVRFRFLLAEMERY